MEGKIISWDQYSGRGIIEPALETPHHNTIKIRMTPGSERAFKPGDLVEFYLEEYTEYGTFARDIHIVG